MLPISQVKHWRRRLATLSGGGRSSFEGPCFPGALFNAACDGVLHQVIERALAAVILPPVDKDVSIAAAISGTPRVALPFLVSPASQLPRSLMGVPGYPQSVVLPPYPAAAASAAVNVLQRPTEPPTTSLLNLTSPAVTRPIVLQQLQKRGH